MKTYTITRNTRTGILEYLTVNGWRSDATHHINERLYFNEEEGRKKVSELRRDCRIPVIAKSIILNY